MSSGDKYSAVWVSHSSLGDYLKCPRAYYLNNVYKDKNTGHKITLMQPALALGQAVHEVLEALSLLPVETRFKVSLSERLELVWPKISGKKGGFENPRSEQKYKERGLEMLRRVERVKGPLAKKAVKMKTDLPHFWLSEEDGIILCGKIDWMVYVEESDGVHIIDFKTGKKEEDKESLQLPIYLLLVNYCQKRKVVGASYWYLETSDDLSPKQLPDLEEAKQRVLKVAKMIKLARKLDKFECPNKTGCFACRPLEQILRGEAELVGVNDYKQDVYVLKRSVKEEIESEIL